jgi:hypothetical protein
MKCEITSGKEEWLECATDEPEMTVMGCGEIEIAISTSHGRVLMTVSPGDPCAITEADLEVFRAALERRTAEALAQ